jgi:predicted acylesterase/phospholipase RssA
MQFYLLSKSVFFLMILSQYTRNSFFFQNSSQSWIRSSLALFSQKKESIDSKPPPHNIVNKKKDKTFLNPENATYLIQNEFLQGKRLISISPGGFKGFYLFGVLSYIKENYDLTDFIYSGASAGAWNSLFMSLQKPNDGYFKELMKDDSLKKATSIFELEQKIKAKLLAHYQGNQGNLGNQGKEEDFDFRRLFIGVTTINKDYHPSTTIYNDFENLEDAIDCCIASSHIPFITGGMINQYNGRMTFDGGFQQNPYLNINKSVLHVSPSMWIKIKQSIQDSVKEKEKEKEKEGIQGIPVKLNPSFLGHLKNFWQQTTLFKKDNYDFLALYEEGYKDAKENKEILDDIILYKNYSTNYYYT